MPVFMARFGFAGWETLFGLEWMMLTTIGRKSGKKHYTMVDVLLYERDMLHVGEIEYGWLASAEAVGAVLTDVVLTQRTRLRRQGITMLAAVAFYGIATMIFEMSTSVLMASAALMLVGAADSVSMIIRNIIRQSAAPDHIHGRMVSINQVFFMGGPQLGEMEAGAVAHAFGVPFSIISGGIGCLIRLAVVVFKWP